MFLTVCCLIAFALFKDPAQSGEKKGLLLLVGIWFFGVLFISRNLGALVIALAFLPLLWFAGPRLEALCAAGLVALFLMLPMLRQAEIITLQGTISAFERISPERADSLAYRVRHEDMFLERAALKPITGWGGWSRSRVHDPETGADISVADGAWIIFLGKRGWIGYIAYFGMLGIPILLLVRRKAHQTLSAPTSGMAVLIAAILIYQIPNFTLGILDSLMAGALTGYAMRRSSPAQDESDAPVLDPRVAFQYTRFPTPANAAPLPKRTTVHARMMPSQNGGASARDRPSGYRRL
jgi:hypothetical protein